MIAILKKQDYEIYGHMSGTYTFKSIKEPKGLFIKMVKYNDRFSYFICSIKGIKKDDSYIFSEGEYIGDSYYSLLEEDITLNK